MNHDLFVAARVVHILAVVLWIGGVAFVTTVLIPSIRNTPDHDDRLALFERLEGRFGMQAKVTTVLAGLSGFYMLEVMDAWSRYASLQFWWTHLMTLVWAIFTVVLFVLEPLFLHRWFAERATKDSDSAFSVLQWMHILLLTLSLVAVAGAMAGAHGFSF